MSHYFLQDSPLAGLERQMMMVPNFTPRRSAMRFLGGYTSTAADVDCRYCLQYHRKSCRSLTCPYLAERLEAGAVTLEELADSALVNSDTLLLVLNAAMIARYGPQVMKVGRVENGN